ncbi:MAG: sn-glycerol-3-phosphate ABC transporter ATP-binding protein UgpC [Candidatus Marinimicrobia bacterium]|nr:sn-glycerol-3-phosphate ABC transporter ATP-binding protein UgpC [Candidatus Neomarinimicrobiota bacterium]
MAEVRLKKIKKSFGDTQVLYDINLDVINGEFLVLVGPSGCGKSTLLRIVAGLEDASGGEIFIGKELVNDVAPKNRAIAMVFQNYALYPHMNVYDNMAFGLKLKKVPKEEIREKVMEAAAILGIEDYLKRRPKEMSGGQRQRVALGRAIVRDPSVFLFDEPLSNLDAKLRVQMRSEIKKLHKRLKTTMMYVTHDQVEAMTMGDRIVVMKDGYLMQSDSPLEIYKRPANKFVASFIGSPSMNFMDVEVRINSGLELKGSHFNLKYSKSEIAGLNRYQGKMVTLGIRPEHLNIDPKGQGIEVEVDVSELMGSESYLHARLGESEIIARVGAENTFEPGDTLHLATEQKTLHFFDAETGERIN